MSVAKRLSGETLNDIQGFITSGYGHLRHAAYLFVHIDDAQSAQRWLRRMTPSITTSKAWPIDEQGKKIKPVSAVNLALTVDGLAACGLPTAVLCTFVPEFIEGIASAERARRLGDTGESAAAHWEIGGPNREPLHAVVIVHAQDQDTLDAVCEVQRSFLVGQSAGAHEIANGLQQGYRPETDHEPFGFHDGIAQPAIRGFTSVKGASVPAGEFILGYENHYGSIAPTPVVSGEYDPQGLLPRSANPYHSGANLRDLGRNGTYVVYRKLRQDVAGFWQFMKQAAQQADGAADPARMLWLAAKCVGRWPSGAPLTLAPNADDARLARRDDFLYAGDADGYGCPLGAHVRRTNPRDVLKPYPVAQSLSMTEAHRILRRARVFGPPLFDPHILHGAMTRAGHEALQAIADDGKPRGLHFFCVNASIKSQFEFIQQNWCNNPRFGGLHDNKDPLVGSTASGEVASRMTIPGRPDGTRTPALPRLVTVSAGAYLFMPSVSALRFLAAFTS
ncbi:MAG TPA: hypothetical protein VK663_05395 [Burkholderiales bacterium]|nr:hypothetical protein [Burkholderiales bacterium]